MNADEDEQLRILIAAMFKKTQCMELCKYHGVRVQAIKDPDFVTESNVDQILKRLSVHICKADEAGMYVTGNVMFLAQEMILALYYQLHEQKK